MKYYLLTKKLNYLNEGHTVGKKIKVVDSKQPQ